MTTATVTPISTRKPRTRAAAKPAADDKPTVTADQLNAATTQQRLAAARGQGSSAKSVTGTNKPAAAKPPTPARGKPAAGKPAPAKPAGKSQPAKAAAPVKTTNSEVGAAVIRAAADMIAAWKPADHAGISQADARELARKWLSYLPSTATWDKRLGERSDAGRRRSA